MIKEFIQLAKDAWYSALVISGYTLIIVALVGFGSCCYYLDRLRFYR